MLLAILMRRTEDDGQSCFWTSLWTAAWRQCMQTPQKAARLQSQRSVTMKRLAFLLVFICTVALFDMVHAQAPEQLDKLQRADGAKVLPDKFLRSWDPITIFFDRDQGPANGGPEDAPERIVSMQPAVPGAWQWLGPRALQFRPADAWKPLQRVVITSEGHSSRLIPLLPTPVSTSPADHPQGIANLDQIAMTFGEPVEVRALARLLSLEVRPSPGIDATGGQMLTAQDFDIRPLERTRRNDKQTYSVQLHHPIPDGRVLILRLRLSDEPDLDEPSFETRLRSAVPFTVTSVKCGRGLDRDTIDDVMHCAPEGYSGNDTDDTGDKPSTRRRILIGFSSTPESLDVVRAREV